MDNILRLNSCCLTLFRVSQHLYRPLRRCGKARVIEKLLIVATEDKLYFVSAELDLRLLEKPENTTDCKPRIYSRKVDASVCFRQCEIDQMNADICWPTEPLPTKSIPTTALTSDIIGIEQICLVLVPEHNYSIVDYSCSVCKRWNANCVSVSFNKSMVIKICMQICCFELNVK